MSRILMIAKGSFGDLFPMMAIAQALMERGHEVAFAAEQRYLKLLRGRGYIRVALNPVGAQEPQPKKPHSRLRKWLGKNIIATSIRDSLDHEFTLLAAHAEWAELVIGNQMAFATSILAEAHDKPWAFCAISPMAIYSNDDPSLFPVLHRHPLAKMDWPWLRRLEYGIARTVTRYWDGEIRRQRRRHGLPERGHPLFEGNFSPYLNLLVCSPQLLDRQADWPANTVLGGFTWFEARWQGVHWRRNRVRSFMEDGAPPVVVGLGAESRTDPGRFYHVCAQACRKLGLRMVAVAPQNLHYLLPKGEDICVSDFVPYSQLFDKALLVIHSAGVGTLAWCLRFGRYSIVSPGGADQFDNAARAQRRGFATVVPRHRFDEAHVEAALSRHLEDATWQERSREVAEAVAAEDGAQVSCDHIEQLLADKQAPSQE